MYRVLLISLLVSVFGSHGISVLDTYGSRKFSNLPLKGDNKSGIDISEREPIAKQESSTEVPTVSGQEDHNSIETAEIVVYNKFEKPPNSNGNTAYEEKEEEEEEEELEGPPDHVIPYSEHEEAKNVSTKPKYTAPGEWAKPAKGEEGNLEFVPSRVYAQVRQTHTLRRLPRRKAIENAESEEEKENAARLREVVKNTKVNTVYTEEGYEDSAYDHGGRIRDADFHEGYARKLHDQLDHKKNSKDDENGDYDEGENETKQRNYKKVRPEDLNEFDEDYSDRYEPSTEHGSIRKTIRGDKKWRAKVNPKVVTAEGVETLQEDLEREAAEIEKGVELGRLEESEITTDRETLAESQRSDDHNKRNDLRWRKERQRKRLSSSRRKNKDYDDDTRDRLENAGALQNRNDSTADSVDREIESTTLRGILVPDSSGSYKYDVDGNSSPNVDPIDYQRAEENPSTVSYSQLFWDYFKRQPNQLYATEVPGILESTTFNPIHVQGLPFAENVNLVPYSVYGQEAATAFPMIEHAILNPQQIVPIDQTLFNSEYSKNNIHGGQIMPLEIPNANELWQSINANESPTTETVQFSEIYLSPQKNLDSNEELGKNFGVSTFDPTLTPFNRKPRYKMTIRHKPNKPKESLGQESITSNPIIQPLIEGTTPESVPTNENYMKVLLHLLNEKNTKNHYRSNGVQQNNFIPSNNKNQLEDLTRLRPPLPQKPSDYYYNFSPHDQPDIDATQSVWSPLPHHQRLQQTHANSRKPPIHLDPSHAKQTLQLQPRRPFVNRKRNILPPFEFIPPSTMLRNDPIRHKETLDYVNRGGNRSNQGRKVLRPFRQTFGHDGLLGIRVKRRERRSAGGQVHGDVSNGAAKGTAVNNATSNRGEIEQPAKNPSMERNCTQKVTRGVEVGLGLDTSPAKQPAEKKSRSCANDRGEGSRVTERESSVDGVDMDEGRNGNVHVNLGAFKYNEEEKGKVNVTESTRTKRSVREMKSKTGDKLEERFENDVSKEAEGNIFESERTKRNVEEVDPRMNDKLRLHEKLLDEAPRIAEDVVQAEINARFNENGDEVKEKEDGDDDGERKVDVEVPEFDYVEEIMEEEQVDENLPTTEESLNFEKYPFYSNENLPMPSALKYATDPGRLPRKTYGGMEFYNSRDAYKQCDEVEPDLEVLPEKEEPVAERGPEEKQPRLRGLGDKLNCFKAKYFDNDPFDNPLFLEKEVKDPEAPQQLDTKKFASRIMMFPNGDDDYVIQRSSKRPENYRQPRKPISVRFQKTGRVRYKNYPRTRTRARPRKRPTVYRVRIPQVRNSKNSRKPQNVKNLVTSSSEVSSLYMPYQNQVYEDVMGTIKNLASSYRVQEIATTSSPEETTMYVEIDDDVKRNASTNSTSNEKNEKNKVQIDIMDQPSDLDINIKGMIRPKNRSRHRPAYKRTRRPQRNKPRIHMIQTPVGAVRTVKHRPRIRVYKRDLRDSDESREEKWSSDELGSTEDSREEIEEDHSQRTDSENIRNSRITASRIKPAIENDKKLLAKKNTTIFSTVSRPTKRKVLKSVRRISASNGDKTQEKEKNGKLVYTIKDRIRYSKPKPDLEKVGKFVNETEIEEDRRRGEPKYNYIKRKNSTSTVSVVAESSAPSTAVVTNLTEIATTTEKIIEEGNPELKKEAESTRYLVDETRNESTNASAELDDSKRAIEKPKEETINKTASGYAVYENVNEGESATTRKPLSATPSEFFSLKTFLEIDPPGYMELSTDDFKRSFFSNNNSTDNFDVNSDSLNSNATEKEDTQSVLRSFRPSYFAEDESSEKAETKTKVESSTGSSEEISAPSKGNDSEEDRTFFTYTPRPSSLAENYEDEKYSDLGPRVNKPAFYHPPFSVSKYRKSRSKGSSEEIAESDEQKEIYVFPWQKDKEDQRKRRRNRHRGKSTGEYEYPWEKRERLAREENRRKGEQRKRLGNSFVDDDDDEEAAETFAVKQQKTIHPRGRYRFWSRKDRDAIDDNGSDNAEGSGENRPAMKYSSRYNSKGSKLPLSDKPATGKSRSVEEISRSIKQALEGDSEEKGTSREKEDDSSWENKPSFSYRPRSISRVIVPEDVTLAPNRKPGKRGKLETNVSRVVSPVNKSSSGLKNSLDNSESQINAVKTAPREIRNSTNESNSMRQSSKKRRRPLKNAASAVESATVADTETSRSRGRQKFPSTTSATIIGATSASRVIRRRNHKSLNDTKKDTVSKGPNKSTNNARNGTDTSKSGTVERRSRSRKKNRTNEIINGATKNEEQRMLSTNDPRETEHLNKANDEQERNPRNEATDKQSIKDYLNKNEEGNDSKGEYPSVKSEEKYDYKDDRMVALSDSDKSDRTYDDDDDDFGSTADTDGNFTPQNGALQLSEQGSKELVTAVSWTSENYDF